MLMKSRKGISFLVKHNKFNHLKKLKFLILF